MTTNLGRIHVITGPGKGKTTAAFGLAMRAAGHGLKVCVIQFMKTGETTGEVIAARRIPEIEVRQFGTGSFVNAEHPTDEDRERAKEALSFAKAKLLEGGCQLLILDEINIAAHFGLVDPDDVVRMLSARPPGVEIVLTGRNAPLEFVEAADYVSTIDNWKHPFEEEGLEARQGIEW